LVSYSDPSIAAFAADGSGVLTGVAAGQVTLTTAIGSVSAQTQVTVLAGSSVTTGTVLWSAPSVSGCGTQNIVQALRTGNGPDLYSIEACSSGGLLVRAFTVAGTQLWQGAVSQIFSGLPYTVVGDASGGLLINGKDSSNESQLVDLNAQTGSQNWQYSPSSASLANSLAVGLDGTIYVVDNDCSDSETFSGSTTTITTTACLNGVSASSGTLVSQATLPNSFGSHIVGQHCDIAANTDIDYAPGAHSSPIVAPDGSVYMEMVVTQTTDDIECTTDGGMETDSFSASISILKNGTQFQTLNSGSSAGYTPSDIIPDGNGGLVASYIGAGSGITIASTSSGTQAVFPNVGQSSTPSASMVLGDNNAAFVTDGTTVVAFNPTTLLQDWSYSTSNSISFVAATSSGGVAVNDSSQGIIQLDSVGTPSAALASLEGANYFGNSLWVGLTGDPVMSEFQGIFLLPAAGPWPFPLGNDANGDTPRQFDLELVWCLNNICSNLQDQNVDFSYRSVNLPHPSSTLTSANAQTIQQAALNAFQTAFHSYKAQIGSGKQGTNTVYVVGEDGGMENGANPCANTASTTAALSRAFYPTHMSQAQFALNIQTASSTPTQAVLLAIGQGIGNNAAHEIAHQFSNYAHFTRKGYVVADLDDSSLDTYNGGTCDGGKNPGIFTGVAADGVTKIHWETTAAQSLENILGKSN
jgi:outer membrane protein assembly factor BamB